MLSMGTDSVNAILISFLTLTLYLFIWNISVVLYQENVNYLRAFKGSCFLDNILSPCVSCCRASLGYPEYQEYSRYYCNGSCDYF
jgi:hypothetical protein